MSKNVDVPLNRAGSRLGVREVKLRHFTSGNVVTAYDDGCDDRGRPNQQRQHLVNTLKKRLRFAGDDYPTFILAEPPAPWPTPRNEKEAAIRAGDRFDVDVLKDLDGNWRMATPKWEAGSEKARASEQARADEARRVSRSERGAKALDALEKLGMRIGDDGKATPKKGAAA